MTLTLQARFLQALLVTRPLTGYMNTVSLVETVRCRLRMKARGILKASSTCQDVAPSELMSMSLRILSGAAGWTVVSEYTTLLQAPASDDMWLSDMGLEKQSCVHLLLIGAADAFRRLILPFESLPWSLFKVINEDDDAAMTSLHTLRMQHRPCDLCWDQLFAAVFIDWVLSDNIPLPKQMRRLRHLKLLLGDVLLQLPTSTVDVERSHANIQVDASNHKAVPKRPANIQADSLITHTVLEHSQVKALVEDASLGDAASRVRRTMRARRIESAAPGSGMLVAREGLNADGTVRRRPGMLKGMLSLVVHVTLVIFLIFRIILLY